MTLSEKIKTKIAKQKAVGHDVTSVVSYDMLNEWADDAQTLQAENERLREAVGEAINQIEYLHQKFQETGSGNAVLSRLKQLP
jgi:hypothetical protein